MAVKSSNKYVVAMATSAKALATADARTYEPFFNFMEACVIARAHKKETGLTEKSDFDTYLASIGVDAANRKSESWSITKLGDLKCAAQLMKNLKACKPSKSGLYFAACAVRATGFFAEGSKAGLTPIGGVEGWKKDSDSAPSTEKLAAAIKAGMKASNAPKAKASPKGIAAIVAGMLKTLTKYNVKGYQRNGKKVAALNNSTLTRMIDAGSDFLKPKAVKGAGRKAA